MNDAPNANFRAGETFITPEALRMKQFELSAEMINNRRVCPKDCTKCKIHNQPGPTLHDIALVTMPSCGGFVRRPHSPQSGAPHTKLFTTSPLYLLR